MVNSGSKRREGQPDFIELECAEKMSRNRLNPGGTDRSEPIPTHKAASQADCLCACRPFLSELSNEVTHEPNPLIQWDTDLQGGAGNPGYTTLALHHNTQDLATQPSLQAALQCLKKFLLSPDSKEKQLCSCR